MASRDFLVLIAIALVPFVVARQNPSDKEASQIELTLNDELHESLGLPIPLPPLTLPPKHKPCLKLPATAEGSGMYEPSDLDKILCPPPPAPVPGLAPTPAPTPTSPAPTPSSPVPTPSRAPAPAPTA